MKRIILKSVFAAVILALGVSVSAQDSAFKTLRDAAEVKYKAHDYKGAIELLEKSLEKASNDGERNAAYGRLTWLYAWGSEPNRFDKAAETYIAIANLKSTAPKHRAGNMRAAADYLVRIKDYDRAKIYSVLEDAAATKDLADEDKAGVLMHMARVIREKDPVKAEKNALESVSLAKDPALRNRMRMEWARSLNSGEKPELDKAVAILNDIIKDNTSSPKERFSAVMEGGRWYAAKNKLAESNAEYAKASAINGISEQEKAEAALAAADNLERVKKQDAVKVLEAYKLVAENNGASNAQRIKAYRKMLQYMSGKLSAPAKDIDAMFTAMWNLPAIDKGNAKEISELAGNHYFAVKNYDRAIEEYSKCVKYDANLSIHAAGLKGRVYAAKGDALNAEKCFTEAGKWGEFAAFQFENGKKAEAFKTVLDAVKKDPKNTRQAFGWFAVRATYAQFASMLENELKPYLENDPSLGREFARMTANAMQDGAYGFVIATAPYVVKADPNNNFARLYFVNALSQTGRVDEAKKLVSQYAADPNVKDAEFSYRFKAIDAALKAKDRKSASEAVQKVMKDFDGVIKDKKRLALITGRAASTPLMMNLKDTAQGIDDARRSMFAFMPNKSVKCEFVENLPRDITGWWESDIVKSKRNVQKVEREPWEDNVDFLVATDAATVGRTMAKDAKGGIATEFYTFCDARGVYVFIVAYDDNAKAVSEGLADGGSYEGYMAPGKYQPYYCFLTNISNGNTDDFKTAYRNEMTRRPTFKDRQLESNTRLVAPNAIATLLAFPWEYFWNALPSQKGDTWQFDVLRWTGPGYSWSGMSSVHNRSTWGDFVFDLSTDQLVTIHRNIILAAKQEYARACGSDWRGNGIYHFWNDTELGDVKFYKEKLLPLREKLDGYKKMITPDMKPETIEMLFKDAVPLFMNICHIINRMHTEYLEDKVFAE